jgi:hypothetical protein
MRIRPNVFVVFVQDIVLLTTLNSVVCRALTSRYSIQTFSVKNTGTNMEFVPVATSTGVCRVQTTF